MYEPAFHLKTAKLFTARLVLGVWCCVTAPHALAQSEQLKSDSTRTSDQKHYIYIQDGHLSEVITQISRIYDINILFSTELIVGENTNIIIGTYSLDEVLDQALKVTPFTYQFVDASTVAIVANRSKSPSTSPIQTVISPHLSTSEENQKLRLNQIVVTGTRVRDRSAYASLAPIDIIDGAHIRANVSDELSDGLARNLPSFTAYRYPLSDGLIFNRPTGLRSLNSEHTLVLVNGKRRHKSAFLESTNGHAVDLSQIPLNIIERVEVLRDGASAQYGSDAIAGVINVILDDNVEQSVFVQTSQYYEGDGTSLRAGIRSGKAFANHSFFNFDLEAFGSNSTSRSRQRQDAIEFEIAHPEIDLPDPVQRWGKPHRKGVRFATNLKSYLSDDLLFYSFTNLNLTEGSSDLNWRNPDTNRAYNQSDEFPNFTLNSIYPKGFTPTFGMNDTDIAIFAGFKNTPADIPNVLAWDFSVGMGQNTIDYFLHRSINASLGPQSPTSFKPGTLQQSELVSNFDVSYQLPLGFNTENLNIAAGLEARTDAYRVKAGDPASYAIGPGILNDLPPGSNGFPGYTQQQAINVSEVSSAAYFDTEVPLTPHWTLGFATRIENSNTYDNNLTGKLSSRYSITPELALRATYSTGFHAPTQGQLYSERTFQSLDVETLDILTSGRLASTSPVAHIVSQRDDIDITPLRPELSNNYSIGFSYTTHNDSSFTADFYQINVEDRLSLTNALVLTPQERAAISQIEDFKNIDISTVNFLQNNMNTRTRGIDLVASKAIALKTVQLDLTAAYNFNETRVLDLNSLENTLLRLRTENQTPKQRASISANVFNDAWSLTGRLRYYGPWKYDSSSEVGAPLQTFGEELIFDLSFSYDLSYSTNLQFGVENLFNNYPDEASYQSNRGLIYSRNAPYDTDGGVAYIKLKFKK